VKKEEKVLQSPKIQHHDEPEETKEEDEEVEEEVEIEEVEEKTEDNKEGEELSLICESNLKLWKLLVDGTICSIADEDSKKEEEEEELTKEVKGEEAEVIEVKKEEESEWVELEDENNNSVEKKEAVVVEEEVPVDFNHKIVEVKEISGASRQFRVAKTTTVGSLLSQALKVFANSGDNRSDFYLSDQKGVILVESELVWENTSPLYLNKLSSA